MEKTRLQKKLDRRRQGLGSRACGIGEIRPDGTADLATRLGVCVSCGEPLLGDAGDNCEDVAAHAGEWGIV